MVFRNTGAPLFVVERKGLEEVFIETAEFGDADERARDAWCWKYRVRDLIDTGAYEKKRIVDTYFPKARYVGV
ncbi:hypothetical protein BH23VER1_BH23VER1_21800 [soil metagenome]